MRKDVVEAEEEDHQSWSKDEKNVHRIIREKSCKRRHFWIYDDDWSATPPRCRELTFKCSAPLVLARYSTSQTASSIGRVRRSFISRDNEAIFCLYQGFSRTWNLMIWWMGAFGWGHCFVLGDTLKGQLIILVSLMWPSIHPGFLMRLERSKSGFHLHQGWRVRAFMFYGFPRANSRWQDDGGRNRKPVHGTFSRHSKVTSTSPLSRLGP